MCRSGWPTTTRRPSEVSQHLDRRLVEVGQRLGRDHVGRLAREHAAARDVDDAIEIRQQRVHVVRDEQDRHPLLATDPVEQRRNRDLIRQVEAVERLVEEQQLRPADECLRDQEPLLLAAGELADRAARQTPRLRRAESSRRSAGHGVPAGECPSATRRARGARGRRRERASPRRMRGAAAGSRRRHRTVALPVRSGSNPSSTCRSVDLPAPFGPSTATNSPFSIRAVASAQIVRPPSATDASTSSITAPAPAPRAAARAAPTATARSSPTRERASR